MRLTILVVPYMRQRGEEVWVGQLGMTTSAFLEAFR